MNHEQLVTDRKVGTVNVLLRRQEEVLEILDVRFNNNGFYFSGSQKNSYFEESLGDEYISLEMYRDLLKNHPQSNKEQFFEVYGDVYHESWKDWTDCGWEYDAREWIDNEQIRLIEDKYLIEGIIEDYKLDSCNNELENV